MPTNNLDITNKQDDVKYLIVTHGLHLLSLIKDNPIQVCGILDVRNNGSIHSENVKHITNMVFHVGEEKKIPLLSIYQNINYYRTIKKLLLKFNDCKIIITGNHYPLARYIIDIAGINRIELWEDGMNHYITLERTSKLMYWFKCIYKLSCGYYPRHLFHSRYLNNQLLIRDRFIRKNLKYRTTIVSGTYKYYIGQPLIENQFMRESTLKKKYEARFKNKGMFYLPHPREESREWMKDIFTIIDTNLTAEEYIIKTGAAEIHSACSTVNINLSCAVNVFHCQYLGLTKISKQLEKCNFNVDIQ